MSLLHEMIHHPRRVWLRRAMFQVHLWVGLLFSLYLVLLAISGSVLVYKDELTRWRLPEGLHVYRPGTVATPATVLSQFQAAEPGGTVAALQVPSSVLPVFLLQGKDRHQHPSRWIADPVTGALQTAPRTWLDTVHDLHVYLLLPPAWGMQANAVGAAALLLLAGTGALLWWPGVRRWTRGLRIDLRANWRRLNYDVHNALGFWTLAIVVWWAISGVYFGWYRQVTAAIAWVSPLQGMRVPQPAHLLPAASGSSAPSTSLTRVLQAAQTVSPQSHMWSVSDPLLQTPESFVLLDRGAPGDFSHRDIVRVRTSDAQVLSVWHYGERHSLGDWVLWSMHPLHFGTVGGAAVKLVWCVLGLSLAVLTVTGLLMYWNRVLRRHLP